MLYRVVPLDPLAEPTEEGGARFVARALQGQGRHDAPSLYGAIYVSRSPVSAVAERLRRFRGRPIVEEYLRWERQLPYAIVSFDDRAVSDLVDLDDPRNLEARGLRPSTVATATRKVTQRYARAIHAEGAAGLEWWSTIEASWINVTLFAERVASTLRPGGPPEALALDHPAVREAAEVVGVSLAGPR